MDTLVFSMDKIKYPPGSPGPWLANQLRLEVIDVLDITLELDRWSTRNYIRPFNAIFVIVDGEISTDDRCGQHRFGSGAVILYPVASCMSERCHRDTRIWCIRFNARLATGFDLLDGIDRCLQPSVSARRLARLCAQADELSQQLALQGTLMNILGEMVDENRAALLRHQHSLGRFGPLYAALEEEAPGRLRVAELAARMGLSPANLAVQFKQATGLSVKSFISRELVRRAGTMLLLGDRPVQDIAAELGFDDPFHFSRLFKQHSGLSPQHFRDSSGLPGAGGNRNIQPKRARMRSQ